MEVHEIRYFLAAARELNFTKAARTCNVSQPALTRAIQKLEGELGGPLFTRRPGAVELTQMGRSLLPRLEAVEKGLAEVLLKARDFGGAAPQPLRIGVMCTVMPGPLVAALSTLKLQWPQQPVIIKDARAEDVVKYVVNGEVDIAISAWPTYPPEIEARRLATEPYVVIVPDSCELAPHQPATTAWVSTQTYLQRLNCEFDDYFEARFGNLPFDVSVAFSSEREDWIQSLVAQGCGVAIIPESMPVQAGIRKHPLVEPEVVREVELLTLRNAMLAPAAREFLNIVAAQDWS